MKVKNISKAPFRDTVWNWEGRVLSIGYLSGGHSVDITGDCIEDFKARADLKLNIHGGDKVEGKLSLTGWDNGYKIVLKK